MITEYAMCDLLLSINGSFIASLDVNFEIVLLTASYLLGTVYA